ncbi:MAG: glucose-6-phosphate isomerase [Abditibacteriota bacterium]|nr:glucose-6-phosphate isomerase [Abditibacteriota bacterium]
MKLPIKVDITNAAPEVASLDGVLDELNAANEALKEGTCPGADFTGWLKPDAIVPDSELSRVKAAAERLRPSTDVMLVIGIGGSYLGSRAVIEALAEDPEKVMYLGCNTSGRYFNTVKKKLAGKRVAVNVISKSGTTLEPGVAFRLVRKLDNCSIKEILVTTDARKGALLEIAKKDGYETFTVPDNVGGRYSVLSSVGLLPIAYAGIDIDALVAGATECAKACDAESVETNPAYRYAGVRNLLYRGGKSVEILASFEPCFHYFAEWWKQLYAESEGKDGKGIFTASADFTTDLHSIGQFIQDGTRIFAETFVVFEDESSDCVVPEDKENIDKLNYVAGKDMNYVSDVAYRATAKAHRDGGVPNITIRLASLDERTIGAMIYFFEKACGLSAGLTGVNAFNQPGVEAYKKNMREIFGAE